MHKQWLDDINVQWCSMFPRACSSPESEPLYCDIILCQCVCPCSNLCILDQNISIKCNVTLAYGNWWVFPACGTVGTSWVLILLMQMCRFYDYICTYCWHLFLRALAFHSNRIGVIYINLENYNIKRPCWTWKCFTLYKINNSWWAAA